MTHDRLSETSPSRQSRALVLTSKLTLTEKYTQNIKYTEDI